MTEPAHGSHGLLRAVVGNAVSLTGGRLLLALLRFAVALVIVQRAGLDRFGEFALVLSFVMMAEWLSDFGLGDVAVRQISAHPERARATMGAFVASKAVQGVVAALVMAAALAALGYTADVVRAGLIAGLAVVLYAGVQVYRVNFRARMQMARDVGAELASGVFFLGAIWVATGAGASLEVLALCYVLSRAVNLAAAALLAGERPSVTFGEGFGVELRVLVAASVPLGFTGLVVSAYDAMDAIALAHWSTSAEVGIFTVAMRMVMIAVIAEQALATAVFPVLARRWTQDREAFVRMLQQVLDWGMVMAGALFCGLQAGALGLASLAKQDPHLIAQALQVLSWAVLARAVVTIIGPMVVIAGRMHYAVWIQACIAGSKWLALMALAPQGAMGAAAAYLVAEIGVGLLPAVYFCQRAAGVTLRWGVTLRVIAVSAAVVAAARFIDAEGSIVGGMLAVLAYALLAWAAGAIRVGPLRDFLASVRVGRGEAR